MGKGGRGLGRKLEEKHWKEGIGDIGLGLLQIQSGFIHSILFSPTHHHIPYGQHPYSPPQIQSNRVIWHIFDAFGDASLEGTLAGGKGKGGRQFLKGMAAKRMNCFYAH